MEPIQILLMILCLPCILACLPCLIIYYLVAGSPFDNLFGKKDDKEKFESDTIAYNEQAQYVFN